MKKFASILVAAVSLTALSSATLAATEGGYAGLGLGYSKQETPNKFAAGSTPDFKVESSNDIGGLGGRIFGGYNFNKYVGIEAGIAQYAQSKNKVNVKGADANLDASLTYSMTAFDLVGKAYLPIAESGFNVYGLGGLALVHSKQQFKVSASGSENDESRSVSASKSNTQNKVLPVLGVGASYDIPQTQLTTALEYSHTFGKGNLKTNSNAIPSADLITLNIAYNFG